MNYISNLIKSVIVDNDNDDNDDSYNEQHVDNNIHITDIDITSDDIDDDHDNDSSVSSDTTSSHTSHSSNSNIQSSTNTSTYNSNNDQQIDNHNNTDTVHTTTQDTLQQYYTTVETNELLHNNVDVIKRQIVVQPATATAYINHYNNHNLTQHNSYDSLDNNNQPTTAISSDISTDDINNLYTYTQSLETQLQQYQQYKQQHQHNKQLRHYTHMYNSIVQHDLHVIEQYNILSGLILGFALTFLAQTQIPDVSIVNNTIQSTFSVFSVLTISMNALCLIIVSLMYFVILQYNDSKTIHKNIDNNTYIDNTTIQHIKQRIQQYKSFWSYRCSYDVYISLLLLLYSLPVLTIDVALLTYVQFYEFNVAKIINTVICSVTAAAIVYIVVTQYHMQNTHVV